jgi:hypothetical protein
MSQKKKTLLPHSQLQSNFSLSGFFSHLVHMYAGLPDGVFSYQKYQLGDILEGLGMENSGIFYEHLQYLMAIW